MTTLLALFSGWWTEILAGLAVIAALVSAYFGGKKIGTTQTQAKADVDAAQKDQQQVQMQSARQTEIIKEVKDVQQSNNADSDSAARDRMRSGSYYSKD